MKNLLNQGLSRAILLLLLHEKYLNGYLINIITKIAIEVFSIELLAVSRALLLAFPSRFATHSLFLKFCFLF